MRRRPCGRESSPARRSLLLGLASAGIGLACQPARLIERGPPRPQTLRINIFGEAGFAPLLLLRERGLLERRLPGLAVEWKPIPEVDAVHDALAAGGLDLAAGAPTAFFRARQRGLPVRILAGLAEVPSGIVTPRHAAHSLADFGPSDRIGVASSTGYEATLLRLAALRDLGDWHALDAVMVSATPARTLRGLQSGQFAGAASQTPALDVDEQVPGARRIVSGEDLLGGPSTSALVYALPALHERQPALVDAVVDVLHEGVALAASDWPGVARLIPEADGLGLTPEDLAPLLARSGLRYGTDVRGLDRLAEALQLAGEWTHGVDDWRALVVPSLPPS
ncbi:MAG: ABC transporter substrate-binding protein [Chloroflexi bacterium]|nr:ABC transporter substrate-binding protein [Chloroflexota bacterium]